MLIDKDGRTMGTSHANKGGRRYRYSITKPQEDAGSGSRSGWRLPAVEIEAAVLNELSSFLSDKLRLMTHIAGDDYAPDAFNGLHRNAANLAKRIAESAPSHQREILLELIDHIQVEDTLIRVNLKNSALQALRNDPTEGEHAHGTFVLDIEVAFRKRGAGMKLILSEYRQQSATPDPKLIAAVSDGRRWFSELQNGTAGSIQELADIHAANRTSISRLLPYAFLAPDIVEAILDGRQPTELTVSRLKQIDGLPVSWVKQRKLLHFPQ